MNLIEWIHPTKGKLTEIVCDRHTIELKAALYMLGIPFVGDNTDKTTCYRCLYAGYPFRQWMELL
jgi:hypothetical protein